jgi:Family of unknown function (DUF5678)
MSIVDTVAPVELPSEEELAEYDDLWVAVSDGKVVASGKTPRAVLKAAEAQGIERPIVFHVPFDTPGQAFF